MTDSVLCLGLMSGTSMDGIDVGLIKTNGTDNVESIANQFFPYPAAFQQAMKRAEICINHQRGNLDLAAKIFDGMLENQQQSLMALFQQHGFMQVSLAHLIELSTLLHAEAVLTFLAEQALSPQSISVIGYHGQTVYHAPEDGITMQLGDSALLAKKTGIPVVGQFRLNDVKQGGQGAPLAPIYHWALAHRTGLVPIAIVNCGGIANITLVLEESPNALLAFDTGPGNVLLDRIIRDRTQGKLLFDKNGELALKGQVNAKALAQLHLNALPKDFFSAPPPKSLDSYDCKIPVDFADLSLEDACATLAMFTAECIVASLAHMPLIPQCWVLAGGGWKNPAIAKAFVSCLQDKTSANSQIYSASMVGWHPDALEAEAFAYLAKRSLAGLALSFPGTTGVPQPASGGQVYYP